MYVLYEELQLRGQDNGIAESVFIELFFEKIYIHFTFYYKLKCLL